MESLYRFIIKPKGERYDNEKKVGDKSLITNTRIETFQSVSKKAIVIALPEACPLLILYCGVSMLSMLLRQQKHPDPYMFVFRRTC